MAGRILVIKQSTSLVDVVDMVLFVRNAYS